MFTFSKWLSEPFKLKEHTNLEDEIWQISTNVIYKFSITQPHSSGDKNNHNLISQSLNSYKYCPVKKPISSHLSK